MAHGARVWRGLTLSRLLLISSTLASLHSHSARPTFVTSTPDASVVGRRRAPCSRPCLRAATRMACWPSTSARERASSRATSSYFVQTYSMVALINLVVRLSLPWEEAF